MLDVCLIVLFLYVEQEPGHVPPAEAGPSWAAQAELSAKPASSQARQPKGQTLLSSFVFLFPLTLDSFPSLNSNVPRSDAADTPVLSVGRAALSLT